MSDRAMVGVSGYDRRADDRYWTHPRVTETLLARLRLPPGVVWEPASGRGDIVVVLRRCGYETIGTDVRAYSDVLVDDIGIMDFLDAATLPAGVSTILTNPPFKKVLIRRFIEHSLALMEPSRGMVVMLLRNEWDSASTRRGLFQHEAFAGKFVLTWRPRWDWWEREKPKASPRHNYSWFVWNWRHKGRPTISYLP